MKNSIKPLIAGLTALMACVSLNAQNIAPQGGNVYYMNEYRPSLKIDWKPDTKDIQRYTVAIRPLYLTENGLKLDFEFELNKPGDWLRVELIGHHRRRFNHGHYDYRSGWSTINSGYDTYHKLGGAGAGLAYKSMFTSNGWYYSVGAAFNYFNVGHEVLSYHPYVEDGITFYERGWKDVNAKYYKPEATVNIGKHFALSRSFFADMFLGLGFAYSFYEGENYFSDTPYAFGGRGLFINAGFRIGWLISNK